MMENKLKISFIASLIGILTLIIISNSIPVKMVDIKNLDDTYLGKKVAIQGTIFSINNYEDQNFQTMIIKNQSNLIRAISNSKTLIEKTTKPIRIIGKIEIYNNELQINADKIIILT